MIEPIVEINGEKYILWHYMDEYKVNESIMATPLKDWKKLYKDYEDTMDCYLNEFCGIFTRSYDELKETLEEFESEDEEYV